MLFFNWNQPNAIRLSRAKSLKKLLEGSIDKHKGMRQLTNISDFSIKCGASAICDNSHIL
ncbi:MAG: hypothetical protein CM15mP58_19460 [Burkholderiaceae bacterium]|nr:MAG: hypothetical protein CM15mP58_19460 [Burkholderiaceae bacterium]